MKNKLLITSLLISGITLGLTFSGFSTIQNTRVTSKNSEFSTLQTKSFSEEGFYLDEPPSNLIYGDSFLSPENIYSYGNVVDQSFMSVPWSVTSTTASIPFYSYDRFVLTNDGEYSHTLIYDLNNLFDPTAVEDTIQLKDLTDPSSTSAELSIYQKTNYKPQEVDKNNDGLTTPQNLDDNPYWSSITGPFIDLFSFSAYSLVATNLQPEHNYSVDFNFNREVSVYDFDASLFWWGSEIESVTGKELIYDPNFFGDTTSGLTDPIDTVKNDWDNSNPLLIPEDYNWDYMLSAILYLFVYDTPSEEELEEIIEYRDNPENLVLSTSPFAWSNEDNVVPDSFGWTTTSAIDLTSLLSNTSVTLENSERHFTHFDREIDVEFSVKSDILNNISSSPKNPVVINSFLPKMISLGIEDSSGNYLTPINNSWETSVTSNSKTELTTHFTSSFIVPKDGGDFSLNINYNPLNPLDFTNSWDLVQGEEVDLSSESHSVVPVEWEGFYNIGKTKFLWGYLLFALGLIFIPLVLLVFIKFYEEYKYQKNPGLILLMIPDHEEILKNIPLERQKAYEAEFLKLSKQEKKKLVKLLKSKKTTADTLDVTLKEYIGDKMLKEQYKKDFEENKIKKESQREPQEDVIEKDKEENKNDE